jgi:hypothetical protein
MEWRTQRLLESVGYTTARVAGSHGPWDVIGWSRFHAVFVQVKAGREPSRAEREALAEEVVPRRAIKFVHVWKPRRQRPEVYEL